jgi:Tfp pilus assembly protein PilW
MVSKPTSTNRRKASAGTTLVEALVTIGVTGLIMMALASMSMVSGRSFAAFANYVDLDSANRTAMDTLTRDLRECNRVTSFSATHLVIEDGAGFNITYSYNPGQHTLTRTHGGVTKTLLKGCDALSFNIAQRNPVNGSYDVYPAATATTAKVVNVSWNCSRTLLGFKANTENVQTARIVIRRQG